MGRHTLKTRWPFLLLLFLSGNGAASNAIISDQQRLLLLPYISVYYDASATATINQISTRAALFQNGLNNASLARADGAYWL